MSGTVSNASKIASRYADALFSLAKEQEKTVKIGEQLEAFSALIHKSKPLERAVYSPLTSHGALGGAMADIAKEAGGDPLLVKMAGLLGQAGRMRYIEAVVEAYKTRLAKENDMLIATVRAPKALKAAQRKKLEEALSQSAGKTVEVKGLTDQNMLGGVIITIGSKMLDYSVRGRLAALKNTLYTAGH